jgi:hypothetical protein
LILPLPNFVNILEVSFFLSVGQRDTWARSEYLAKHSISKPKNFYLNNPWIQNLCFFSAMERFRKPFLYENSLL